MNTYETSVQLQQRLQCTRHLYTLSDSDRNVFALLAAGHCVKDAADELNLSPKTVEYHRAAIVKKLGLPSAADIPRCGVLAGVVQGCPSRKWRKT